METSRQARLGEVLGMKKKWYAAGLGFVLFLCVSAESIVNLLF